MRITAHSNKKDMEGIPLALDAERPPMLELLVIGNLESIVALWKILKIAIENSENMSFVGEPTLRRQLVKLIVCSEKV